jgi:hypothetical protein
MKTVKSALLGNKQLVDTDSDILLIQLKEVIQQHRDLVITRLMGHLSTYLTYRFEVKTNKDMLVKIKDKLVELNNSNIDLSAYDGVVQLILTRTVAHLANEPFFREIDACLSVCVLEE